MHAYVAPTTTCIAIAKTIVAVYLLYLTTIIVPTLYPGSTVLHLYPRQGTVTDTQYAILQSISTAQTYVTDTGSGASAS